MANAEIVYDEEQLEQEAPSAGLDLMRTAEVDMQVSTAKKYPRSVARCLKQAVDLVSLSEAIAEECFYAIKRGGKVIEGPSARLAEILAYSWTNCKAGARVIDEGERFVTAQGVFWDLERNVAITYETRRRITDKNGRRYNDDMITVTANAACSIALRNAVFKAVPKAVWKEAYAKARMTAIGNAETLSAKRQAMVDYFGKMGVSDAQIFAAIEVQGLDDVTLDHLALLKGIATAIKDGDTTIEQQFDMSIQPPGRRTKKDESLTKPLAETPAQAPGPEPKAESESIHPPAVPSHLAEYAKAIHAADRSVAAKAAYATHIKENDQLEDEDRQDAHDLLTWKLEQLEGGGERQLFDTTGGTYE